MECSSTQTVCLNWKIKSPNQRVENLFQDVCYQMMTIYTVVKCSGVFSFCNNWKNLESIAHSSGCSEIYICIYVYMYIYYIYVCDFNYKTAVEDIKGCFI